MGDPGRQLLPGYERDINNLIDCYALIAQDEQVLSFQSFRQLFSTGCYAYIHQAYWGCEHSPEYAQLLFAAALDRLDLPSSTAPAESPLWQLHQLVPTASSTSAAAAAAAGGARALGSPAAAAAGGGQPAAGPVAPAKQPADAVQDALGGGHGGASEVVVAMDVDVEQHARSAPPSLQLQQQQPQQQLGPGPTASDPQHPQLLQEQQQAADQQQTQQQQQQQRGPREQALNQLSSDGWMNSPLLQPQQPNLQGTGGEQAAGLSPSDLVWQLMSPLMTPLQQQGMQPAAAGAPGLEGLEGFMLPEAAMPGAAQQQDGTQPHASQQAAQDEQQQQPWTQHAGAEQQQQPLLQQRGMRPAPASTAPGTFLQGLQLPPAAEGEDDFLADLLAIFDEAPSHAQHAAAVHSAQHGPAAAGATPAEDLQHQQQQPQQRLALQIPLVVKGAVVFAVLALHESQLNYPKVPIYVPLPLLQQLGQAAAEFRAAGTAAADALQALHVLTSQQRLLVGQFRRPNHWEPQLPAHLMPGGRLPAGLGAGTAIGAAARKAARAAAKSAMQSAAVGAAARAARGAAAFDPGVHREAMFHIKTALRHLSNFKSLQSLCEEYAAARRAVFEPLLGSSALEGSAAPGAAAAAAAAAPAGAADQPAGGQLESGAEGGQDGADSEQPGPMVVMRGGSRRKRKAAAAAAAAAKGAGAATRAQSAKGPPPAQAAADAAAAGSQAQQPTTATRAAQAAADLPELFDSSFATALQGVANREAARMLLLLDPYYNANKVRQRAAEEKRAARAAEAAAAAEAKGKLDRFRQLTMARAGSSSQQESTARQPQSSTATAAAGVQGQQQDLVVAAGVYTQQQVENTAFSMGAGLDSGLSGGVQQVMRRAVEQQQTNMQVAHEWLRAHSVLEVVDAAAGDADEDMP